MNTKDLIQMITVTAQKIGSNKLNQLRIEESLLVEAVTSDSFRLEEKKEMFERINKINSTQLQMLGKKLNYD